MGGYNKIAAYREKIKNMSEFIIWLIGFVLTLIIVGTFLSNRGE